MYFKLIVMFLIFLHISGCFWHYISILEYDNNHQNWISIFSYHFKSDLQVYVGSLYFILTVLFTVGLGDIVAVSFYEKCFVIIYMFIGVMMYCYFLAYISNLLIQTNIQQSELMKQHEFLEQSYFHFQYPTHLLKEMLTIKS